MERSGEDAKLPRSSAADDPPHPPPPRRPEAAPANVRRNWLRDPLILGGLLFFSPSVAVSAYRSRRDPSALTFIVFAYLDLVSLFFCLRWFERLAPGGASAEKARLKAAVWVLAAALMLGFSWKVAAVVPWALAASIWVLAGCVVAAGFYGLFLYEDRGKI